MVRRALIASALAAACACAPRATLPDAERDRVFRELAGQDRWLRVAVYAGPLWGDRSKLFVTDQPPAEVHLLESAGGATLPPPAAERVVAPGTRVRIARVEFPTSGLIMKRVVMTPRFHPWVYLEVAGDTRPHVIVLSQEAASYEDVRAELERFLSTDDPAGFLGSLPQEQRDAILRKEPAEGMTPRALEMAWGVPERKKIDRPAHTEEWVWPAGLRRAFLQDDRVVRWERAQPAP